MRAFILLLTLSAVAQPPQYDLVIHNARIIDGTGSPWFYGDIAVNGDTIARITPRNLLQSAPAKIRVDAEGRVVSPGFIDIQSHSRGAITSGDGRVVGKVSQGVTTEIMGEGSTNAPANEKTGNEAEQQFAGPHGFARWLEAMKTNGASVNFGSFVGHATIRAYGKGYTTGEPNPAELASMKAAVKEAMEDGAFGLASALIYPPASYSSTNELIELSKVMAPLGGTYITHMRSEADDIFPALDEVIKISKEAKVPAEIYHLKMAGKRNWPKAAELIASINNARAQGVDLQANMYTYPAGSTGLTSCLPPWAAENGKLYQNIDDLSLRPRLRAEMTAERTNWENLCNASGPENVLILGVNKPENKIYAGKRLSEIAAAKGKDWVDTVFELLSSERQRIGTVYFMMSEENVELKLKQPWMKFGSDASGLDPENPRGLVHPRSYGNFTRLLGYYVRERKVMPLEEAVRKMSSATATRLHLQDRGLLKPGLKADIVVFNPDTVGSPATYTQPDQVSTGIDYVFVNGVAVWVNGRHTGAKPGQIVRGPGYQPPAQKASYDIVYLNAKIVDGTGAGWFYGDLATRDGKIARIALPNQLAGATARKVVQCDGLVLSPGFIDIQSHSREAFLNGDGRGISKVTQGITSEIMGEGWSNAPANAKSGSEADANFTGPHSFDRWLKAMATHGASANFGSFVGGGTLRAFGRGFAMGDATSAELKVMSDALTEAMRDGAFGIATALIYPPGSYAGTKELTTLAQAMAPFGGTYISHIRSEGNEFLEAIEEAVSIGRNAQVPIEIYHLKAAGRENWKKAPLAISLINASRVSGVDIQANMYPYEASGTGLTAMLPDWAAADGKLWANLDDPKTRQRLIAEMLKDDKGRSPELVQPIGLTKPETKKYAGLRLNKIAEQMKLSWPEAAITLLRAERQRISTIYFTINESNIALQLQQPWMKVATDSGPLDPANVRGEAHPRSYGTYPRVLGYFSRELKTITLEDAVFKMSGAVATRLQLHNRGILREGMAADLVLFDPKTVKDTANFEKPHSLSTGIRQVVVNGTVVVDGGVHTGAKPGQILRGPGYTPVTNNTLATN